MDKLDFEYVWKAWFIAFLVLEGIAIKLGGERTLSHHVWAQFNVKDGISFELIALGVFLTWLLVHMVTGGKV